MVNQKNNVLPHLKKCGLIGTCFLDARKFLKNGIFCTEICQREQISCARSVPHTKVCGFQTLRHDKIKKEVFENISRPYRLRKVHHSGTQTSLGLTQT